MSGLRNAVELTVRRLGHTVLSPETALPIILIGALAARLIWLDRPAGALIFDEAYYVNASRVILGLPVEAGAPYATAPVGLDPNIEHPPLGKLLIAGSMRLLGDNALGWRLPSVIAGMIVLFALYMVVRQAGETARFATLAMGLLAFDNLTVVHSRIATLDVLSLAPILVATWFALRDRWLLAGILVAVGFLIKITALYGLVPLVAMVGMKVWARWRAERTWDRNAIRQGALLAAVFAIVGLVGLWLLDLRLTTFASPIDHVRHMLQYGASLTEPGDRSGICVGATSAPWQWPFNECQINYLRVDRTVTEGDTIIGRIATIDFRGALNPLLASGSLIATLFVTWYARQRPSRTARWAIVWIAANFLPLVLLSLVGNRVTYIYYMLPVVPGLAVAITALLLRSGLPLFVTVAFLAAYLLGFAAYFPFRQLP